MYNVPTYTKFRLHRVPRTDHRRKSRTPCTSKNLVRTRNRLRSDDSTACVKLKTILCQPKIPRLKEAMQQRVFN